MGLKTVKNIAAMIDLTPMAVYRWCWDGLIEYQRLPDNSIMIDYDYFCKKFNLKKDVIYISPKTIAERLGFCIATIRTRINHRMVDDVKIIKSVRFPKDELDKLK